METIDAVVLAAGRLSAREAQGAGGELKALIRIGGTTPLAAVLAAIKASRGIARVIVVGPRFAQEEAGASVDEWIDERPSGEENLFAGLRAARTHRALVSASDMPFVNASYVADFLARTPTDADFAYAIYTRDEFLSTFPGGRSKFARVGNANWTGGSLCLLNAELALRNAGLIRRAFAARRSQFALAALLGAQIAARHMTGRLAIEHIEGRLSRLTGGKAVAIRGAHPALAMDLDSAQDVEYARARSTARGARGEQAL